MQGGACAFYWVRNVHGVFAISMFCFHSRSRPARGNVPCRPFVVAPKSIATLGRARGAHVWTVLMPQRRVDAHAEAGRPVRWDWVFRALGSAGWGLRLSLDSWRLGFTGGV